MSRLHSNYPSISAIKDPPFADPPEAIKEQYYGHHWSQWMPVADGAVCANDGADGDEVGLMVLMVLRWG